MSNNLGQIYATSKSANKYIVLESDNVASGNFYINGTNSRMPAEFENSIRNYLPLTYGTTDSNATTLFEKFDDLSQNVLKQRKDASFNNVDISGYLDVQGDVSFNSNLNINGDLTLHNGKINNVYINSGITNFTNALCITNHNFSSNNFGSNDNGSTIIGVDAGNSLQHNGLYNVAYGHKSSHNITTGCCTVCIGTRIFT